MLSSPPLTGIAEVVAAGTVCHGTLGIYHHNHGLDDSRAADISLVRYSSRPARIYLFGR